MPTHRHASTGLLAVLGVAILATFAGAAKAAEAPSVEQTLSLFKPTQKDVEYETPPPEDFKKCRISVERVGKTSGWVVFGPSGQVLRRFVDSDGDQTVDQWRYYNHGLEVYRDIDTNHNRKPDECRWLNTGGSRWAVDSNEDGRIDSWKSLSPEEAVRIAMLAILRSDEKLLQTVLVTQEDLTSLGVADSYAAKILNAVADSGRKIQAIETSSKILNENSKFTRADNLTPASIPAEKGKLRDDLFVYENAMAIVDSAGKPGLVQIGELVRVGDVWKLTQIPQPIEGNATMAGGILMQPTLAATVAAASENAPGSAEVQKVLAELQKLDQESPPPTAGAAKLTEYNAKRADILSRLVAASSTDEERNQWMRQMVDSIASAVQIGTYAEGLDRLKSLEADVRHTSPKSPMIPYIAYRRLLAEYASLHQASSSTAKQQENQKWWRGELEKFTKEYPAADDTAEATLQLAIAQEFIGQLADARHWYSNLADRYPQTKAGHRAIGALRRLELKGKAFDFSGPALGDGKAINAHDYHGKVLLVSYWSTWCTACTQDLPVLKSLFDQYNSKGFEILGVSLDVTADPIEPFLRQNKVSWPQIFQPGGTESEPAAAFGVIVPPLMILVDRQGKVAAVTTTVDEIKAALPGLLGDKKAD
ncbi:MAG TPA: redoxin domain-containing protein [Planctomycetaceae bacterium]|jgi:peroxiredoxin|nr:redoxin domain-containing protein [Planctomycetaceae bacterium]